MGFIWRRARANYISTYKLRLNGISTALERICWAVYRHLFHIYMDPPEQSRLHSMANLRQNETLALLYRGTLGPLLQWPLKSIRIVDPEKLMQGLLFKPANTLNQMQLRMDNGGDDFRQDISPTLSKIPVGRSPYPR